MFVVAQSRVHKLCFIGFMERKMKLIFIFMTHSFRCLSLSGPLHPFHYTFMTLSGETSRFIRIAALSPPSKISRLFIILVFVLANLFYCLPHSCWHFHFYPLRTRSFSVRSSCGIFRMMNNDSPHCSAQVPPHIFIARPNYRHCEFLFLFL